MIPFTVCYLNVTKFMRALKVVKNFIGVGNLHVVNSYLRAVNYSLT